MRLTLLFFGVIIFGCFIQTQDALFTGGKSLQEHFESLLSKFAKKTSNKLQGWLDVLKDKKYANLIWRGYRKYYKKNYTTKGEEKERFGKFIDNVKLIVEENFRCERGNKSFRMKINEYGDMNIDEFKKKMTGLNGDGSPGTELPPGEVNDRPATYQRRRRSLFDSVKKKVKDKIKKKINELLPPGGGSYPSGGGSYPSGGGSNPSRGGSYPSSGGSYSFTVITRPVTRKPTGVLSKASVDYRPYMNPVENQGRCGSCYAFAVTSAIEGTHAFKNGQKVRLSKQELIDCSGNNGCQGGYLGATYKYIADRGGLEQESSYPYRMTQLGVCSRKSGRFGGIKGHGNVQRGDEEAMKQALIKYGPLAAAIHTTSDLQFYAGSSGGRGSDIIDIPFCSKQVDHAIAIVGFGTENGKDYWIVRNSWGPKWGLDGYFKIARNKNMCGIGTYGYYTIV